MKKKIMDKICDNYCDHIKEILEATVGLYLEFTKPTIKVVNGMIVDITMEWINEEAETAYRHNIEKIQNLQKKTRIGIEIECKNRREKQLFFSFPFPTFSNSMRRKDGS